MLILTCSLLSACLVAQTPAVPKEGENAALRAELHSMVEKDQEARMKLIEWMKKSGQTDAPSLKEKEDVPEVKRLQELDKKHTTRLKEIVEKHGWPGITLVGVKGAHDAWLLVQHADHDRAFQKRCLQLMEAAAKRDEVSKQDLAYLTDRVLVGEGKKQRFGTQFKEDKGEMVPQPIEDEANVDSRRAEAGLVPLAEYKKMVEEMYKKKAKEK